MVHYARTRVDSPRKDFILRLTTYVDAKVFVFQDLVLCFLPVFDVDWILDDDSSSEDSIVLDEDHMRCWQVLLIHTSGRTD